MAITILAIGLFVFAAFLFKGVFDRTGIPDVLLLMVCGIVIGPLTGWVVPEAFGQAGSVLATLALVIILFESGVDLELSSLRPSLSATLKISLVTFSATAAIVTSVGIAIAGLPPLSALMLGAILGGTSSAVVIPLVQSLNVQGKARTVMVLESALTDVLCIVGLFMLVDAAKKGATSPAHVAISLSETLFFAAGIGIVAGIAWLLLLRTARRMPHGSFASTAMCCVIYGLTEMAGLSGAIAKQFGLQRIAGRLHGVVRMDLARKIGAVGVSRWWCQGGQHRHGAHHGKSRLAHAHSNVVLRAKNMGLSQVSGTVRSLRAR